MTCIYFYGLILEKLREERDRFVTALSHAFSGCSWVMLISSFYRTKQIFVGWYSKFSDTLLHWKRQFVVTAVILHHLQWNPATHESMPDIFHGWKMCVCQGLPDPKHKYLKTKAHSPGWVLLLEHCPIHQKVDSQSGHIPRMHVNPWSGCVWETGNACFLLSLSLSFCLHSLSKNQWTYPCVRTLKRKKSKSTD